MEHDSHQPDCRDLCQLPRWGPTQGAPAQARRMKPCRLHRDLQPAQTNLFALGWTRTCWTIPESSTIRSSSSLSRAFPALSPEWPFFLSRPLYVDRHILPVPPSDHSPFPKGTETPTFFPCWRGLRLPCPEHRGVGGTGVTCPQPHSLCQG